MGEALRKLSEEDPTFRVHSDENTGQTIIRGMGELHLDSYRGPHAARIPRAGQCRQRRALPTANRSPGR